MKVAPGNWKTVENTVYQLNYFNHNRWYFHVQPGWTDEDERTSEEELKAVARLAAAAPKLLEALQWYIEIDEVDNSEGNAFWLEGKAQAEAAVAAALGETDGN